MKNVVIHPPLKEELTPSGFNKNIKVHSNQTSDSLLEYGFSNHDEPTLYFYKDLGDDISFNLLIDKKTLEIKAIDVLDEEFLQPFDYQAILMKNKNHSLAQKVYHKVNEILTKLQTDEVITGFRIGMYV